MCAAADDALESSVEARQLISNTDLGGSTTGSGFTGADRIGNRANSSSSSGSGSAGIGTGDGAGKTNACTHSLDTRPIDSISGVLVR